MRPLYDRWWDALRGDRCTWHCGDAREDICRCRCGGKYHGVYYDHRHGVTERLAGEFYCTSCRYCAHPAGLHIIDQGCRACPCAVYEDGPQIRWSAQRSDELLAVSPFR